MIDKDNKKNKSNLNPLENNQVLNSSNDLDFLTSEVDDILQDIEHTNIDLNELSHDNIKNSSINKNTKSNLKPLIDKNNTIVNDTDLNGDWLNNDNILLKNNYSKDDNLILDNNKKPKKPKINNKSLNNNESFFILNKPPTTPNKLLKNNKGDSSDIFKKKDNIKQKDSFKKKDNIKQKDSFKKKDNIKQKDSFKKKDNNLTLNNDKKSISFNKLDNSIENDIDSNKNYNYLINKKKIFIRLLIWFGIKKDVPCKDHKDIKHNNIKIIKKNSFSNFRKKNFYIRKKENKDINNKLLFPSKESLKYEGSDIYRLIESKVDHIHAEKIPGKIGLIKGEVYDYAEITKPSSYTSSISSIDIFS